MAEFRRERVLFHIVAQGSIEVDIEVGAETAEQAFRHWFTPANYAHSALVVLVNESDDLDWVITCATEPAVFVGVDPSQHEAAMQRMRDSLIREGWMQDGQGGQVGEPTATDPSATVSGQTSPGGNEI